MSELKASKLRFKAPVLAFVLCLLVGVALFWVGMNYRVSAYDLEQLQGRYPVLQYDYSQKDSLQIRRSFSRVKPSQWVELNQVPSRVWSAVVISEDWAFFEHRGMDWLQLWRAIRDTIFSGSRLRGASTLSQQLVKNLFLSHERSFLRKLDEAWLAGRLEESLTKREILEIYLNIVEWGEGIVGLGQASMYYFSKPAQDLRAEEAAFLAFLLPSPLRYSEQLQNDQKLQDFAVDRMHWILEGMAQEGYVESELWSHESVRQTLKTVLGEAVEEPLQYDGLADTPPALTDTVDAEELKEVYENLDTFIEESLSDPAQVDEPNF